MTASGHIMRSAVGLGLLAMLVTGCGDDAADTEGDIASPDGAPRTDMAAMGDVDPAADGAPADAASIEPDAARPDAAPDPDAAPADGGLDDGGLDDGGLDDVDGRPPTPPDAGAIDAAASDPDADAGVEACAPTATDPIEAPADVWTWVPVDGMRCADGSPTGIGVNLAPGGADRVMIYLIGGGACWDEASCYRDERAAFITGGFGAETFAQLDLAAFWFFDRRSPDNPFADHHQVFVPYCTGDLHAGDRVADYGGRETHHVGAPGFEALAARLAATVPDAERVILVGGSAGGYGALLNWHRARAAWPCARVDVVDDAGAPIPTPEFPAARRDLWARAWNFAETMPADCPACADDWWRLYPYNLERAPDARGALLTAVSDGVIASYMEIDGQRMRRGVERLVDAVDGPGFGAFLVEGDLHVLMAAPVVADGQTVPQWLTAMQADDPAWGTVGPSPLPPCDTLADCPACSVCATQDPCAAEFAACDRLGGCVDAVVCGLGCAPDDVACVAACGAAFGAGQEALDLYSCVRCDACAALCGGCP